MTKPTTGEQKSAEKARPDIELSEAVRIVRAAIDSEENRLKQIASTQEGDPILLEGETSARYDVQMMVDPAQVAKIMLDYWYPVYKVLEEEAPQGMWNELARMVGLESVYSVDL